MRTTTRLSIVMMTLLLTLSFVAAVDTVRSPLTSVLFTWQSTDTVGLPWYPVQQSEVEICSRGLTSSIGGSDANEIIEANLFSPIYRDTVTLLAKKTPTGANSTYYYEVGWYLQPFQGLLGANITIILSNGVQHVIGTGSPSASTAWDGYVAFPLPCDPRVYQQRCLLVNGNVSRVRLEWWSENGTNRGPPQYLVSNFIVANETNG